MFIRKSFCSTIIIYTNDANTTIIKAHGKIIYTTKTVYGILLNHLTALYTKNFILKEYHHRLLFRNQWNTEITI